MAHKLATIALCGIAVSAICLGAAAAIGGHDAKALDLGFLDGPSCNFEPSGKTGSRTIAWDGSDRVSVAVRADTTYRRGEGDKLVVTGDTAVLPHVQVEDGRIELDCHRGGHYDKLAIALPGRTFEKFGLAGSGSIMIDGIDQPRLKLGIAGSGNVQASGKTQDLEVGIAGSGKMKLGQLASNNVEVHVAGSGDTEIAPKGDLEVHIAGSGKIRLLTEPKNVETHIVGSGKIIHGL